MMQKQNMIVVNQTEIAKNIYELVLQGDLSAANERSRAVCTH